MADLSPASRRLALPAALILILAAQLTSGLRGNSVTVDEFAHLPAGISYWLDGSFATYHHNPPLLRLWAAGPVLLGEVETGGIAAGENRWLMGARFQADNLHRYHDLFVRARLAIALLTLVAAALLFLWTERLVDFATACVALALFCFSPTVLAHGGLVTTDAGFALAFMLACAAFAALLVKPTWGRSVWLGVALGVAQLTKYTALLLYLYAVAVWLVVPLLAARWAAFSALAKLPAFERWGRFALAVAVSVAVIALGYGFEGVGRALGDLPFEHPTARAVAGSLGALPSPLPAHFLLGLDAQALESQGQFRTYLFGETRTGGWWYYYPVALFLKTPLPLFLLLGAVVLALVRGRLTLTPLLALCLALPLASLVLISLLTSIDLGVRYLLFVLPFLHVAAAHWVEPAQRSLAGRVFLGVCLLWYTVSSIAQAPRHLAYFSDVVGGAANGHLYLADSNLDWGQDLIRLKQELERRGVDTIALSHFGLVDPAVYGIRAEALAMRPTSPLAAISVNHLLGIDPFGRAGPAESFRGRQPVGRAGDSIWLFDLSAERAETSRALREQE